MNSKVLLNELITPLLYVVKICFQIDWGIAIAFLQFMDHVLPLLNSRPVSNGNVTFTCLVTQVVYHFRWRVTRLSQNSFSIFPCEMKKFYINTHLNTYSQTAVLLLKNYFCVFCQEKLLVFKKSNSYTTFAVFFHWHFF